MSDTEEDVQTPVPDAEDVPAEHRERDQWLMWDAANDAPRRPHWHGDFGVSWTDPDDWGSFEEAREAALEHDSWGIGYVFAYTNDDYPQGLYGGLDLDGCVKSPHGSPKEWLPSLAPFIDRGAHIEWSPSATGLHIPLAGFEPPEWWSDKDAAFGEHEGVEAYGKKFFTVTGDRLEPNEDDEMGAGREVADAGEWAVDWLAEVYKARNGYDPREKNEDLDPIHGDRAGEGDGDGGGENDEWMTEEVAEKALDEIDPDLDHSEWCGVGFALVNHFGSATGGPLFKQWSRQGRKWDKQHAESVIDDAGNYDHDIRYLVNVAKSHGWDASEAARRSVTTAPDGGTATAATDAEVGGSGDETDGLPDPSPHGFAAHNGGYGYWSQSDDDQPAEWNQWTNFTIEVESFLSLEDGSEEFELTVHPRHSGAYTVKVPPTAFNEKRAFKKEVACGRTTTFTGGETALAKIKQFVGTQAAPELRGVRHMGRHTGEMVLPTGTLTADGWDDDPSRRYIE